MNIKDNVGRWIVLAVSLMLLLSIGTGVALAYIATETDPLKNAFEPGKVECMVSETFDGHVKSNVTVKNTGNVPSFIRAAVVVTWQSDSAENEVLARSPKEGVDYSVTWGESLWIKGADGYWYYTEALAENADTAILIESMALIGEAPEGYSLSVEILATAIQSDPVSVVEDEWGVNVEENKIVP